MVDLGNIVLGWPVDPSIPITQGFGENPNDYAVFKQAGHNGVDFGCPLGTPIRAAADGSVMAAGFDEGGYGNYVKLNHGEFQTLYGHMSQMVKKTGQRAAKGEIIGYSGSTGNSTGPHLHFELRIPGAVLTGYPQGARDPMPFFEAVSDQQSQGDASQSAISEEQEVSSDQVSSVEVGTKVKVTAGDGLNVRLTPGGEDVGDLPFGSELEVAKTDGDWVGVILWVHKDWVSGI